MADMHMQYAIAADPKTVYDAITTRAGLASWWTTRVEVPETVGGVVKASFPDMPMARGLEGDRRPSVLGWHNDRLRAVRRRGRGAACFASTTWASARSTTCSGSSQWAGRKSSETSRCMRRRGHRLRSSTS
jgi:hypothetical protein